MSGGESSDSNARAVAQLTNRVSLPTKSRLDIETGTDGSWTARRRSVALKTETHATIDHAAVERCPRVDGPPSVDAARESQQGIPVGLLHVSQVLAIDEQEYRT